MARRVWQAEPDVMAQTLNGELLIVSEQGLAKAVMDGVVLLNRAGGCLSVVLIREPTGVPNEMLTTRAIVEWKDRTDARAQPESSDPFDGALTAPELHAVEEQASLEGEDDLDPPSGPIGDGLDEPAADVDLSSVPEGLRR